VSTPHVEPNAEFISMSYVPCGMKMSRCQTVQNAPQRWGPEAQGRRGSSHSRINVHDQCGDELMGKAQGWTDRMCDCVAGGPMTRVLCTE
jgi:hypothetical protein